MRVSLSFTSIAGVLLGLWLAAVPTGAFAVDAVSSAPQVVISQPAAPANLLNYTEYYQTADTKEAAPGESAPAVKVTNGACGECGGCGGCDPGCCGGWILGIESVWLSPQFQNRAFADYEIANAVTIGEYRGGVPSGLFMTPRVTLGYQGERWGVQSRYWRMSEGVCNFIPTIDGPIVAGGSFLAETIDIEATRLFCWNDWTNQLAFGAAYAQLNECSSSQATEVIGAATYTGSAIARNEFGGPGITLALAGYRPVACRNFNLFYSLRGSVLWDDKAVSAVETGSTYATDTASAGSINGALAVGNGSLFIGEIQLGTQWNFQLCHKCNDAFVRLALEYQYWSTTDVGGARSISVAGPVAQGATIGAAAAQAGEAQVNMIGFTVATGFTW